MRRQNQTHAAHIRFDRIRPERPLGGTRAASERGRAA